MEFGEKLRTLRREKGLSQEELAAMVGVSRQALSKWEAGQSRPELDKLLALSDVFSVTMDSLVRPGGPEPQPDPPASPSLGWWYHGPVIEYKSARTLHGPAPGALQSPGPGKTAGPPVFWPSAMWPPVWCPLDLSHAAASPSAS